MILGCLERNMTQKGEKIRLVLVRLVIVLDLSHTGEKKGFWAVVKS